ncbi:hypothetical protein L533_2088 [Bordetella bronchiseptica OSU553]|nr:hypothetical protein L533_2088 [Bordetella bronchiseptica OSU553]
MHASTTDNLTTDNRRFAGKKNQDATTEGRCGGNAYKIKRCRVYSQNIGESVYQAVCKTDDGCNQNCGHDVFQYG